MKVTKTSFSAVVRRHAFNNKVDRTVDVIETELLKRYMSNVRTLAI